MQYSERQKQELLFDIESKLIPRDSFESITDKFKNELQERLKLSNNSMLPTFLNKSSKPVLSDNNPNKIILAIDFGGTNLKFAIFRSHPTYSIQYSNIMVIENKLVNIEFFENIVKNIVLQLNDYFVTNCNTIDSHTDKNIFVSITFSFPLNQNNEITVMGKNFELTDEVKGQSIDLILQRAFDKYSVSYMSGRFKFWINQNIINDSIAVHLTNKYSKGHENDIITNEKKKNDKMISLILGTGLNVCFELPFTNLPDFKKPVMDGVYNNKKEDVIINSELGFLGADIIQLDPDFDIISILEMPMPLENITSGNALPQILKRVLESYQIYPELIINFDGEMFCQLVDGHDIKSVISGIDIDFIRKIALIIMKRASIYLVAAIYAIHNFINLKGPLKFDQTIMVGYVGSFLAYCKTYQEMIDKYSSGKIQLQFLPDSSLIGAAIVGGKF